MLETDRLILDIIKQLEIDRDFRIQHRNYEPIELLPESIEQFRKISPELQKKYLIAQLTNYLYDIYFDRSAIDLNEINSITQEPISVKNNTIDGIDIAFHQLLQKSNTSKGYFDPDWQIIDKTDHDELIVVKNGLHLHINRPQHLAEDFHQSTIGDLVTIYLPNSLAGQDTYIIVGNHGIPDRINSVELYFNFTPDAAVSISAKLTHEFNQLGIPFQFAILHNPELFSRYDGGTLSIPQSSYLTIKSFLAQIYQAHQSSFSPNIPLFTKQLAPGIGLAEVPNTPGSFGMQRCELVATGLLMAIWQNQTSATDKLCAIQQQFNDARVDMRWPHLNPGNLDIYRILAD